MAASSAAREPSGSTSPGKATSKRDRRKEYEMPRDYKKKVGNPTDMAEHYGYLAERSSQLSKGFDKASIFKQRKKGKPAPEESQSQQSLSREQQSVQKGSNGGQAIESYIRADRFKLDKNLRGGANATRTLADSTEGS
jgi:hypothetical protein